MWNFLSSIANWGRLQNRWIGEPGDQGGSEASSEIRDLPQITSEDKDASENHPFGREGFHRGPRGEVIADSETTINSRDVSAELHHGHRVMGVHQQGQLINIKKPGRVAYKTRTYRYFFEPLSRVVKFMWNYTFGWLRQWETNARSWTALFEMHDKTWMHRFLFHGGWEFWYEMFILGLDRLFYWGMMGGVFTMVAIVPIFRMAQLEELDEFQMLQNEDFGMGYFNKFQTGPGPYVQDFVDAPQRPYSPPPLSKSDIKFGNYSDE